MDKVRDTKLDFLKGFCILCVVLGHVIKECYAPIGYDKNFLFRLCYSFHMPLFFFISGFLEGNKDSVSMTSKWLVNRIIRLLSPIFVWSFIYRESLLDSFVLDPLLWFLNVLFIFNLVHFISVKINKLYFFPIVVYIVFMTLGVITKGNQSIIKCVIFYMPFYMLGIFVWINKVKYFDMFKYFKNVCLVLYPVFFMLYVFQDYESEIILIQNFLRTDRFKLLIHAFLYINNHVFVALFGIGFYWKLAELLFSSQKWNFLKKLIRFIGLYTMQIYLMHGIMFRVYSQNVMMNSLLVFFLSILIPVTTGVVFKFLNKHCKYVKPVSMILFGQ